MDGHNKEKDGDDGVGEPHETHKLQSNVTYDTRATGAQDKRLSKTKTEIIATTSTNITNVDIQEEIPESMSRSGIQTSRPRRMWIDGKSYVLGNFDKNTKNLAQDGCLPDYATKKRYNIECDEPNYSTKFKLPTPYTKKLMDGRYNLNELEDRTITTIKISPYGGLHIKGLVETGVVDARDEIQAVVGDLRDSMPALQFLSIPIRSEQIKERFNLFKNEILSEDNAQGSEKSIFISAQKLHLTIGVFCLFDAEERKEAIKALNEYKQIILSPLIEKTGPLKIVVSGVDCMQTNLASAHVVYANARLENETDGLSLQKIADSLSNFFYMKGLLKENNETVKLHITLINSKYRKNLVNSPERRYVKRRPFNATNLIEKYKDFYFGECLLSEVHLSMMSTVGADGFYKPLSVVKV